MEAKTNTFIRFFMIAMAKAPRQPLAVVYSGGIDSSLVAFCAHQLGYSLTAFTIGFPDSPDYRFVEKVKAKLPFTVKLIALTPKDITKRYVHAQELLCRAKLENNLMQLSLGLATLITCEAIHSAGFTAALSGQGADELFAGYHRALSLAENEINPGCAQELQRLKDMDAQRERVIAQATKLKLFYPYLDESIVEFALRLDPKFKLKREKGTVIRKFLLREAGKALGLPSEIVHRPKAAFQYSSRVQREVIKALKKQS